MNLKLSLKYQTEEYKKPVLIYYIVILCIFCLVGLSVVLPHSDSSNASFNGMEMATVIFLFILGLNSFKETFLMFIQNGISRKTLFVGRMYSLVFVSAFMVVIDFCIARIASAAAKITDGLHFSTFFEQGYYRHIEGISALQKYTESLLFQFFLYLAVAAIGYFITIAYYRMNKAAKIAVSIGVPAGWTVVLPLIDGIFAHGKITKFLSDAASFAFGIKSSNPYHAMISFILLFILFGGLSWILLRKAVEKN